MASLPEKLRGFWETSLARLRQFLVRYKVLPELPLEVLPERDPTFLERVKKELDELNSKNSSTYSPLAGSSVMVSAMHGNINKHIEILQTLNRQLKDGVPVDRTICYGEWAVNTVDSFFVSEDNRYIDSSRIDEFVVQALIACEFLQSAEGAEVGLHEHNFRVMKSTMTSANNLAQGISKALAG